MRTALQFSGGKDSLACLYLLKEQWDDLLVCWVNTGAAYPEMVEFMDGWRKRLPCFVEVRTDQPAQIAANGWPADVVPVGSTPMGQWATGEDGPLIQSYLGCCEANLWRPLAAKMRDLGVQCIVRGQRDSDRRRAPVRDGDVIDGITYRFPLQGWTEAEVFAYLREVGARLPPSYGMGEATGRDCWDCTAYLDENRQRIANLEPGRRAEVRRRLDLIGREIAKQWRPE